MGSWIGRFPDITSKQPVDQDTKIHVELDWKIPWDYRINQDTKIHVEPALDWKIPREYRLRELQFQIEEQNLRNISPRLKP